MAANSLLNIVSILRTYFIEEAKIGLDESTDIKKLLIKSSELESEFVIGKGR
jgi:Ulp1 family protease